MTTTFATLDAYRAHRVGQRRTNRQRQRLTEVEPCASCEDDAGPARPGCLPDRYDGAPFGIAGRICRTCQCDEMEELRSAKYEPVDRRRVFAALTATLARIEGMTYRKARPLAIARFGHPRGDAGRMV